MDAAIDAGSGQFELSEDQRAIREMAEAFASERVAPNALDWDRNRHFPADVIRETGHLCPRRRRRFRAGEARRCAGVRGAVAGLSRLCRIHLDP
jgi:alkylation response protein AidB-like acyl-CoA dehydrogenase